MIFQKTSTFSTKHFWDTYSKPSEFVKDIPLFAYYIDGNDDVFKCDYMYEAGAYFILLNTETNDSIWVEAGDYLHVVFEKGGK